MRPGPLQCLPARFQHIEIITSASKPASYLAKTYTNSSQRSSPPHRVSLPLPKSSSSACGGRQIPCPDATFPGAPRSLNLTPGVRRHHRCFPGSWAEHFAEVSILSALPCSSQDRGIPAGHSLPSIINFRSIKLVRRREAAVGSESHLAY
jgi:hypothetical protein